MILSKHARLDRLDRVRCYRNIREWTDWILCNPTGTHKTDWILCDPTETQRLDRLDHVRHSEGNIQDWTDWPILCSIPTETHKTGQIGSCAAFLTKHTRLDILDHVRHSYRNTHDWTDWIMCGIPTETHMTGQIGSCAAFLPKHTRLDRHDPVHAFLEKHTRLDRFYPEKSDRSVPVQSCRIMQDRHWILHNPTQAYNTGQI